jgi:SAM-dependent methyltransferase
MRPDISDAGLLTGQLEDAREQLDQVEAKLSPEARLWERKWAAMTIKGALQIAERPEHKEAAGELIARAHAMLDKAHEIDRAEFASLHARLASGDYGRDHYRRDLAAMPAYEWNAFTDRLLDVDLVPDAERERESDMNHYLGSGVAVILDAIAELTPNDVFYDLGSGLGKVTLLVAWLSPAKCIGVEYDPAYTRRAVELAAKIPGVVVEYVAADAREIDYTNGTVFYLYDSFRGDIRASVMSRIEQVAKTKPVRVMTAHDATRYARTLPWLEGEVQKPSGLSIFRSRAV